MINFELIFLNFELNVCEAHTLPMNKKRDEQSELTHSIFKLQNTKPGTK